MTLVEDRDLCEILRQLEGVKGMVDYLEKCDQDYMDNMAITDMYSGIKMTYRELWNDVNLFASGLQSLGLKKGEFVALYSENNGRWCVMDLAIMKCGAIDVLRGANAPVVELDYILNHSDAVGAIIQDEQTFGKLKEVLKKYKLKFVALMFGKEKADLSDFEIPVYSYEEILEIGKKNEFQYVDMNVEEPCTMIYTSGTTGEPKGVLLTHKNFLWQLPGVHCGFMGKSTDNTIQLLPIWHSYERIGQYYYLTRGSHLHFTTVSAFKKDILRYKIDTMMSVPRIWEAFRLGIYQKLKQSSPIMYYIFDAAVKNSITYKIHKMYAERRLTNKQTSYKRLSRLYHALARSFRKPIHALCMRTIYKSLKQKIGLNMRTSISGGGAISMKDELFYDAIGFNLRIGYGLTETAPVLTLRSSKDPNFLGSAGTPIFGTEIKIVDVETKEELPPFTKGLVMARGPQVMNGYYKNPEATKAVLSEDGWFNTGDLGWLTGNNNLVLVGRAKETIVLSSGENVEPIPIEEAILGSPYIDQIVLVGQDKSSIGALVVPSQKALEKCGVLAKELKSGKNLEIKNPALHELIKKEISSYIKNKRGLKPFEKVKQFEVLSDSFSVDNGMMAQSLKIKRNNVFEKYKDVISKMFDKEKVGK
ncbi:MAG: AMP-binding protein [bacterium]|nr:AMP-binding protein [bacterium]